jgi:argininosuccinate lyase
VKKKLWGGAFSEAPDDTAWRFGQSIESDWNLLTEELEVSHVHAQMLARQKILPPSKAAKLIRALEEMIAEAAEGRLRMPQDAEDIHAAMEAELRRRVGDVAGMLHTGRSRNDQIATVARLYLRRRCDALLSLIKALQKEIVRQAGRYATTPMPGYTHQQRAQPITLGFHLLAWFWMLQRDGERLETVKNSADSCPLGAAALAGTPFEIDRKWVAKQLGFRQPTPNALDAVSDRDFVADALHACSMLMLHLSRMSQEIILWSSQEFGFLRLPDRLTTGSSIMPQKRNPDFAELIRGRSARCFGHWVAHMSLMKALPLGYNRDTQEDKPPLFDSIALCKDSLLLMRAMLQGGEFDKRRMRAAAEEGHIAATAVADYLASRGMPFREAHERVGRLVRACDERGIALREAPPDLIRTVLRCDPAPILPLLSAEAGIQSRDGYGGPGPSAMKTQLREARAALRRKGFSRQ